MKDERIKKGEIKRKFKTLIPPRVNCFLKGSLCCLGLKKVINGTNHACFCSVWIHIWKKKKSKCWRTLDSNVKQAGWWAREGQCSLFRDQTTGASSGTPVPRTCTTSTLKSCSCNSLSICLCSSFYRENRLTTAGSERNETRMLSSWDWKAFWLGEPMYSCLLRLNTTSPFFCFFF